MRKLLVFLFLTASSSHLHSQPASANLPTDLAWRAVTRDQHGIVTSVEIDVVAGNRWRTEITFPGKQHGLVAVSDGASAAASIPKAPSAALDPRPSMRLLLASTRRGSPEAREQIAGQTYLRFTQTFNGITAQVWANPQTRFPYRIRGARGAAFTDVTYTALPDSIIRDIPDLFSVRALTPLLSGYIK